MANDEYNYRRSNTNWILLAAASAVLVFALVALLRRETAKPTATQSNLVVYCAAGIRKPVEAAAKQYEREYNVEIRLDYGSSGELESRLNLEQQNGVNRCDVYIPADRFFSERAQQKGLTQESIALAEFKVAIALKPDSTLSILSAQDLLSADINYVLCDEQAGVGKRTKTSLEAAGLWDEIFQKRKASFARVPEAANAVKSSADVQAAFIWDATASQFGLKVVNCPELADSTATISADVVTTTQKAKEALHFARYLAAPKKGKPFFEEHHFTPLPGDAWDEVPELVIYCGGVNRNAVAQTISEFEAREGCLVKTHYAGCGTIVGNIQAGKFQAPDAFMTCDASYLTLVKDGFLPPSDVSTTRVVMLVRKGNPKGIQSLKDLTQADLSIGTTDPQMSTLGALSWQMFDEVGIRETIEDQQSVIVTTPTAHELILQMEGHGKLDVALVYEANCQHLTDQFDLVPIALDTAKAVQNIAVGRESAHAQLSGRLIRSILSATSRERFLSQGFEWAAPSEGL